MPSFFEIYTHVSDRKFCNSIGSLVLANRVAVISIDGSAELDAVFSMAKTFSFVHELPILLRISDSVEMCICFAAYSSLLRLYNAVYTVKSAFYILVLQSSCTLCLTAEVELSRHETGPV